MAHTRVQSSSLPLPQGSGTQDGQHRYIDPVGHRDETSMHPPVQLDRPGCAVPNSSRHGTHPSQEWALAVDGSGSTERTLLPRPNAARPQGFSNTDLLSDPPRGPRPLRLSSYRTSDDSDLRPLQVFTRDSLAEQAQPSSPRRPRPIRPDSSKTLVNDWARPLKAGSDSDLPTRDVRFKMSIFGLMVASFLIIMDLTGVSTALPTIIDDLKGRQFEWVGAAYALSSTAFLPFAGCLAQSFGRKPVILGQILMFAIGSALCGASTSMNFLIGGRVVQGLGGGGIAASAQIIISDLVPLQDRGTYNGLIAIAYGLGSAIAPIIAGVLSEHGAWRWFFYINLPICAVAALIIIVFLDVTTPRLSFKEKMAKLDWVGNAIIIASTTCIILALTWGGIEHPWSSAPVLVPLILGLIGLIVFFVYEFYVPNNPMLPWEAVASMTAKSGYVQAFVGNFGQFAAIYYLPLYFQACQGASPVRSGVDTMTFSIMVLPFALITGISIAKTGRYLPQLWLAWCILLVCYGLFSTVDGNSRLAEPIGYEVLIGAGNGILQAAPLFPILAPISVEMSAQALSFFMFVRFLAQTWGISIGGAIIQNQLQSKLPETIISQLPSDVSIVYSLVQFIPTLDPSTKRQVISAFADSMKAFWTVMIALSGLGLVVSFFMRGLPLHTAIDKRYTLRESKFGNGGREEAGRSSMPMERL